MVTEKEIKIKTNEKIAIGKKIVKMLALTPNGKGRYETMRGARSLESIGIMVTRIIAGVESGDCDEI
jgi:hypothetical protein